MTASHVSRTRGWLRWPSLAACTCVTILTTSSGTAPAQETREQVHERQQAARAAAVAPSRTNVVERVVDRLRDLGLFDDDAPVGLYPLMTKVSPSGGVALGGGYRKPFLDTGALNATAALSIRNFKSAGVELQLPRLAAGKVAIDAAIVASTLAVVTARMEAAKEKTPDGAALYVAYCASCHGRSGRGDGPIADYLKIPPADLTAIASRANGVFPAHQMRRIIDGRQFVRAHGDAAMPVWGDTFKALSAEIGEAEVRARIDALVKYLEAMQPRRASNTGAAPAVARPRDLERPRDQAGKCDPG